MAENKDEKPEEFWKEPDAGKGWRWQIRQRLEDLRARWIAWVIWG